MRNLLRALRGKPVANEHAFPQVFNRNERPLLGPDCGTVPE